MIHINDGTATGMIVTMRCFCVVVLGFVATSVGGDMLCAVVLDDMVLFGDVNKEISSL